MIVLDEHDVSEYVGVTTIVARRVHEARCADVMRRSRSRERQWMVADLLAARAYTLPDVVVERPAEPAAVSTFARTVDVARRVARRFGAW